ncbi:MAG: hypothetical protein A2289_04825 [Deltaproteobacteria bacterium RIFOXYA12_FULL_58_15]|nr:MAG: hypothetical protein A2289_04825 [Deltaproteobacteria bacterium RIFOXYA12_FULL_58_15]OGR14008.1 MAG: hypothetical protein A2341_18715 [Deltaproteobacteria bacterium RIFOXYB12_FULL_58_9]
MQQAKATVEDALGSSHFDFASLFGKANAIGKIPSETPAKDCPPEKQTIWQKLAGREDLANAGVAAGRRARVVDEASRYRLGRCCFRSGPRKEGLHLSGHVPPLVGCESAFRNAGGGPPGIC